MATVTTPARTRAVGAFPQTPAPPSRAPQPAPLPSTVSNPPTMMQAAQTMNQCLSNDARYPELDSYVGQGISSEYEIPQMAPWKPFALDKNYPIPESVLEQANLSQVSTKLGIIAEIQHAFIAIDSSLYLWNYTEPNPELIGYEDQSSAITAVKLVKPRQGVFVPTITHLLVVATVAEVILIGVSAETTPAGSTSIALYSTRMSVPVKGIAVDFIEGCSRTGRIFFASRSSNDVWELTYRQADSWFSPRCSKVSLTGSGGASSLLQILPQSLTGRTSTESTQSLVLDSTRGSLYVASNTSTIRVFFVNDFGGAPLALTLTWGALQAHIAHMIPRNSDLFQSGAVRIVSISAIPATESSRLSLMAVTNSGCRIFLSTTTAAYYGDASKPSAPTSIQVHHARFPPRNDSLSETSTTSQAAAGTSSTSQAVVAYPAISPQLDATSKYLYPTKSGVRFSPGFSFFVVENKSEPQRERIFVSAPDSGRIKIPRDAAQATKYPEFGQWIELGYPTQEIGQVTPPFAAAPMPQGFANELAVQFDQSTTEIAILTSTGVQTLRRRRLVDVFAAAIRYGGDKEGREGEVRRFIRMYGRSETAATALAVACGQASDVASDLRVANITDPDVLDFARATFIEHGGRAMLNENSVLDSNAPAIDNVRPSPRHEGMSLYISRLVRSIWKSPILVESVSPTGGLAVNSAISLSKLRDIQRALNALQEFLNKNKASIEGLAGPESLGRVSTKQEELALQGEHRAMTSLVQLISSIIEGIAFVLVLFDERVDEIILSLPDASRQRARSLTYEGLFCSNDGRDLAKELVKAIVNRNIANGSNVDTVAEALRRRCGSFCSANDVVIFKAQEQVKRASEAGPTTESGRMLLNESLRLFQKVAPALSREQLDWAITQYIDMSFYAGAIQLALDVAHESDRANRALSWIRDDSPEDDPRKAAYESRKPCYDLIHRVIESVEDASRQSPEMIDGHLTVTAKRKAEAYDVINTSTDEVFQTDLYDWYMSQGWSERLLEISSPYVISYLRRRMDKNPAHADLLWRYHAHHHNYLEAASVQLLLAKGHFPLDLETRIGYLSRARTNASIRTTSLFDAQQSRQQLLREISDLLDVANIQDDILQRMKSEPRLSDERRPQVLQALDGEILPVGDLYNQYADQAGYHDICILIYNVADHRNPADIAATWQALIEQTHAEAEATVNGPLPYELVALKVRTLGARLHRAEATFPVGILLPMLERYALESGVGPDTWVLELFLDLETPPESLLPVLEQMLYSGEEPFVDGRNRRVLEGLKAQVTSLM